MSATESQDQDRLTAGDGGDPARVQPWFAIMGASLLPALLAFYLPDVFRVPLYVTTGVLYAAACVMLYRQSKNTSRSQ